MWYSSCLLSLNISINYNIRISSKPCTKLFKGMKPCRSPPNNSDGIFSVQAPFELRSSSVYPSFCSRSVLDRFSIGSRSSFVHPPFILRSGIEDRSKIDRRTNGESSEARRRCIETLMGNQGKGNPNKNFIFNYLDSNYYGKFFRILNTHT